MTMDRTLKTHGGLVRARSVLTRTERIQRLTEEGKFDLEADNPLGLPKVKIRHSKAGTKSKKAAEEVAPEAGAAEGGEGAPTPAAEDK
ncbi:MAG TPA: small basic protein [Phycisphaerae bacterium]|nr:small basic protein [Phycisphaerae bacterium]HUU22523.1 small basic protein [Phycisphaerae bacterium]